MCIRDRANPVLWSLNIEARLYLIAGVAAWAWTRRPRAAAGLALALLLTVLCTAERGDFLLFAAVWLTGAAAATLPPVLQLWRRRLCVAALGGAPGVFSARYGGEPKSDARNNAKLLADLAALDLGYIGVAELTARTEQVFATLGQLEQYRGHLLNWYDTTTLRPLPPAYVSAVDSGNLAGALLTLRQGYLGLRERPLIGPAALAGLRDTLGKPARGQSDR